MNSHTILSRSMRAARSLVVAMVALITCVTSLTSAQAQDATASSTPASTPASTQASTQASAPASNANAADAGKSFVERVDLKPLGTIAVQSDGRLKSLSSFAQEMMAFVSGPREINGQDPLFTYLDMLFRPDVYRDADVIYVKGAGRASASPTRFWLPRRPSRVRRSMSR